MAITLNELNKQLASKNKEVDTTSQKSISAINKALVQEKQQPFNFSIAETGKNIPSSGLQYGKNILSAITSPLQTARNILDVAGGAMLNVIPGSEQFFTSTGIASPQELSRSKNIASNVGEYYKQRYGNKQNILQTIQQDPVGTLGDVSAILTAGGSLVPKVGGAVSKVGASLDPLNIATNTLTYGVTKAIPKTYPAKLYESAAKWSTSLSDAERAKLTNTALAEEILPNNAGLAKLRLIKNNLKDNLNKILEDATNSGQKIPASIVFNNLDQARQELGGFKIGAKDDLAEIDKIQSEFIRYLQDNNISEVTPSQLQKFKTNIYKRIDFNRKANQPTIASEAAFENMAEAAKLELEKISPEIKALNARQGNLIALERPLEKAASRIENRNVLGLDLGTKTTAGGVVGGGKGAAIGAVLSLLDLPIPKSKAAIELAKRQKQGLRMFYNNSPASALTRQILEEQGQYNQFPGIWEQ